MKVKTFKASFYIAGYLLEPDVESGTKISKINKNKSSKFDDEKPPKKFSNFSFLKKKITQKKKTD